MNVHLGPVLEQFVQSLIESGYYQSQSEVVREGLRLLKEQQDVRQARIEELRREIAIGTEQARRGELVDGDSVFAEIRQMSAEARKKLKK